MQHSSFLIKVCTHISLKCIQFLSIIIQQYLIERTDQEFYFFSVMARLGSSL